MGRQGLRRWRGFGAGVALLVGLAGCTELPMGERLCKDPVNVCDCQSGSGRGAVVVRWRVADVEIGRLLPRGMCCCNPSDNVSATLRQQCGTTGNQCLLSPAWLLRKVQLHITPVEPVGETCVVTAPCSDGELTTQYCLVPGVYDLQLRGALEAVDGDEFACAQLSSVSPPAVRRVVKAGQVVNLDGIVLGVNAPPVVLSTDGGSL